jgi:hypothetical protein
MKSVGQRKTRGVDSLIEEAEGVLELGICFRVAHFMSLLLVFSDIVRRTPSANPAEAAMKSKMA